MAIGIKPLQINDLPELGQFLVAGFQATSDAEFAAQDVLRWKYFDPAGTTNEPRGFIARKDGRLVGCVGFCRTAFVTHNSPRRVSALHMIDWLGSNTDGPVGMMLMLRAFKCAETQFAIGGTISASVVSQRFGYELAAQVPEYWKILRPAYRLRERTTSPKWKRCLQVARDFGRHGLYRGRTPTTQVELRRVTEFGAEVDEVTGNCQMEATLTLRTPALLNHLLRYPRKNISGWQIWIAGQRRGWALLSVVNRDGVAVGKIADCFLDSPDAALWQTALHSLTAELRRQAADRVVGYGSTPWMTRALEDNGYFCHRQVSFTLRDPQKLLGNAAPFYLTQLEADHAYL